ncbi:MAG: LLM class flavin-dependent oxidoreductase [Gammaproteobacteria bacterium]|nr:LLM class flavin-dependent oxidoreductase [Gammaproteobacteria bacterium]
MKMVNSNLRINMTGTESDPVAAAKRYQTALDMAAYADAQGFSSVNVEEHHCADNAWLPSPLTMAAAIAARTRNCSVGIMALLVTLYDPVRLAEDLAVIDLISNGRLNFVAGMGYRETEFHAMDKPYETRGAWMDHVLDTLLAAWGDEPFEYNGQLINVTPKPVQRPHPLFLVGGMSRPAARRAARRGLPFGPPIASPELEALYFEELAKHGHEGGYVYTPPADFSVLFIDENPDRAWQELGEYFLVEAVEYRSWKEEGLQRPLEFASSSVEALREEKRYEIITPEQCIHRHKTREEFFATIHPLIGGMPLERGWACLKLYAEQVLPALAED